MRHLILILGDQLSFSLSALRDADPEQDLILMAEVAEEAHYAPHHKKKLILIFSAMRHFAEALRQRGFRVHYHAFDPASAHRSLYAVVEHIARRHKPQALVLTHCGEWRLDAEQHSWPARLGLAVHWHEDARFLCSRADFARWAGNRQQLRMEYFYRDMRRRTGLLMDDQGQPVGGQWNYDSENRQRWNGLPVPPAPFSVEPDTITQEVVAQVEQHFAHHFGSSEDFHFAVTHADAERALHHFLEHALPHFGTFQDAMSSHEDWLFHSILSPYLNIGLLDPLAVCEAVARRYHTGRAPLNAAEGFIRQILGWREFVRGIYWLKMPAYAKANGLGNHRPLPALYWTGNTGMACLRHSVQGTLRNGYAHHIQRLMVTGNFALLVGVLPEAICDWYLGVYVDAFDWVELPNTLGMVMHADGGLLGSKPYAASGKYIDRMSDYCKGCQYRVSQVTETSACPFNSLYWHFLDRHAGQFANNPRMRMMYRNWERQPPARRQAILARAEWVLEHVDSL
ncbi:MAG: cryptochrome/photolyase family protein [Gammaproteobacteria bacterium]|nr:cryptochrome/photolyase family protein [Gammaproteobacteria bacterium]